MKPTTRRARIDDVEAIARVHVQAWRETYTGLMPGEIIESRSIARRIQQWSETIDDPSSFAENHVYVAETPDGIVGFLSCGRQRDDMLYEKGFDSEVTAIYLVRFAQRLGIGYRLMSAASKDLRTRGFTGLAVRVLDTNNTARKFYEKLGGRKIASAKEATMGHSLTEVAYGWQPLPVFQDW